ncbi:hypothetical protein [Lactobacillus sp. ESL0230]|uniref:hypothetical protein n=1 Tax=Lactobacillus sp. ESL0230 TaxID=2069353 RepID=UPI000EFBC8A5|nr:hypothetical protein [Lactobacillus sp. ESL0230]RMC46715.1 hypothetical protein F5ESL0230_05545 [Lactobacillus sp. ESL0230]
MKYLLINRQHIDNIQEAEKNLLMLLNKSNNLLLVQNIVLYLISEVQQGKSFKVRAIKGNTRFIIENNIHEIEYEIDSQRTISIFIFLVEIINKWQLLPGKKTWQGYDEKVYAKLEQLLKKSIL